MSQSTPSTRWYHATRIDLTATLVVAALAAVIAVVTLVSRLVQVIPNRDVPVEIPLWDTSATLPLGPGGSPVAAPVNTAWVEIPALSPPVYAAVLVSAIVPAVVALAVIACGAALIRNLLRASYFTRRNTSLITSISLIVLVGWAVGWAADTLAANGARSDLAGGAFTDLLLTADFTPVAVALGIACLAVAFRAGERMQRDTDGLV